MEIMMFFLPTAEHYCVHKMKDIIVILQFSSDTKSAQDSLKLKDTVHICPVFRHQSQVWGSEGHLHI
jgi:hypothetical protein